MSGETEATTIPRIRNVYYATYANLPVTGIRVGDLSYATDRLVFYRWSGAAWQAITIHSSSGVAANIPPAANLPEGSLYAETDTGETKQIQSGAWVKIAVSSPGGATIVRKTGDETVNNSNTLQNDDELILALAANEVWEVDIVLLVQSVGAVSDFKAGFAYPAGCTIKWGPAAYNTSNNTGFGWASSGGTAAIQDLSTEAESYLFGSVNGVYGILLKLLVVNGATPGNLNLQWAQNTATVEDTKVLTNSFIKANKLS